MTFELKLDMYNAEQEAVWLNDFIREHDLDDLETKVKESELEKREDGLIPQSGEVLEAVIIGVASGIVTNRIEWLIKKIWQHFSGKKGKIEFSAECPKNGKSLTMTFELGSEKNRDEAQAEFDRRYQELCQPRKNKKK
ncbi:MAG: hypothetical protein AAGN35_24945 [Bacteroidota bacterium]